MTFKTHPEYWTYSCDECDHEFVHDGRVCPHCGYDENAETVST
jgi:rRNA maturation endonuclease Nob1